MVNGKLQALVAEERFSRLKNDHGYPYQAIEYCLESTGTKVEDIDQVAFASEKMSAFAVKLKAISTFDGKDWIRFQHDYWKPRLYEGRDDPAIFEQYWCDERFADLQNFYDFSSIDGTYQSINDQQLIRQIRLDGVKRHLGIGPDKIHFYDHHSCHAYYALFGSHIRENNTMVYTLDGGGDGTVSTLFRFYDGQLEELARSNEVDIARIYRTLTLLMGMKMGEHEYKVMGLAPYATQREVDKSYQVFDGLFEIRDGLIQYRSGHKPKDLYFWMQAMFEGHRFDGMGAALQKMVEVNVGNWFATVQKLYASRHAVFAGGVAMNVKLNMELAAADYMDDFYVCPSPSDDTLCVGACYMAESGSSGDAWKNLQAVTDPYLGPAYDKPQIHAAIKAAELSDDFRVMENVNADQAASWLQQGKVIARSSGRMEFGARALGNRSILGNPRLDSTVEKINQQIKYRDFWMPFAPVVMSERANDYFKLPNNNIRRPYMMIGAHTTDLGRRELPAAIHRGDFTARPQVLESEQNQGYYDIIKAFESRTGTGCLLNTSFNLHGEPIVCTPVDAISTFLRSELDVLLMEDIAVVRETVNG
jgi:carbamoyltransferase